MNPDFEKISKLIKLLDSDVNYAIEKLNLSNEQDDGYGFLSRSYIKTTTSWAEGFISIFKSLILHSEYQWHQKLSLESKLYLSEHDWVIKSNGQPKLRARKLSTEDNLKAFFYVSHEIFGGYKTCLSGQGWEDWKFLYKIRNQIIHPSNLSDFEITKDDLKRCESGRLWLKESFNQLFDRIKTVIYETENLKN